MTVTVDAGRVLRTLLGVVCLALLTSMGGAGILAAPVTLPLLWFAGLSTRRLGRAALNVVAALTAAEVAWLVAWAVAPDSAVLNVTAPAAAAVAVGLLFLTTQRAVGRSAALPGLRPAVGPRT